MRWLKKIKYFIINHFDNNNDTCWAELVMWAEYRSFFDIINNFQDYKTQRCRQSNTPYAYCGKCEKTGRFFDK